MAKADVYKRQGFQVVSTNYFQATGQPVKASILSLMRQVILLVPLIVILPVFMGLDGVLYAGPIADLGSGVVVAVFVVFEMRRLNRWITETKGQRAPAGAAGEPAHGC